MKSDQILLPLTTDIVFKMTLKDKESEESLIAILQSFLPLPENAVIENVEVKDSEVSPKDLLKKDDEFGKKSILDLKVAFKRKGALKNQKPEIVNVEAQTSGESYLPERMLYYASRLYSGQLSEGEHYGTLAPVYSLLFTTKNLKQFRDKDPKKYRHVCSIRDEEEPYSIYTEGIRFIVVELEKFTKGIEEISGDLENWCFLMKNSGDMNKEEYKNFLTKGGKMKVAAKRLWNISQDEEMRDLLEAREKQVRDHISSVEYAREEGREEGHLKGEQEGIQKVALRLLQKGFDFKVIKETTELSEEEIKTIEKKLNKKR